MTAALRSPLTVKEYRLDELIEDSANANTHPQRSLDAIKDSLKRFGQVEPLVIRKGTNVVIGGNGRLVAMRELGWETCWVHEFAGSDKEATALAITLNRSAQFAEWDKEILEAQLDDLKDEFDLVELGFNDEDLDDLFDPVEGDSTPVEDIEPQIDRAAELAQKWGTELGQLWIIEGQQTHRLLIGDSTNPEMVASVMHGEQAALCLTDPPFSSVTHKQAKSNRGTRGYGGVAIDFPPIDFPAVRQAFASFKQFCNGWLISFLDHRHIVSLEEDPPSGWEFIRFGVWLKSNPMPQINADRPAHGWDGIAYLRDENTKPRWSGGGCHGNWYGPVVTNGDHPTAKPIEFISLTAERFTSAGDVLFDPFGGSGTTLLAAEQLGRRCYGMEISPRYAAVILERMTEAGCTCRLAEN